jgi:DNA-binding transcriptional LysR family regulator
MELTPRGLALLEPVRNSLLSIQAMLGTQPAFDIASARRTFSAMLPDFVAPWLTPQLMRRVTAEAAGVRLQFENWSTAGPARLVSAELDFFVALDNPRLLGLTRFPEALCSAELRRINWVCAVARDHPTVRDELTREQFLSLPHVYVRVPGEALPVHEAVQRQLRLELDVRATTNSVLEVPFMLPGTDLIAILPQSLAELLSPCLEINVFPLPKGLSLTAKVSLFWHKRNESDALHAWMREVFLDSARQR